MTTSVYAVHSTAEYLTLSSNTVAGGHYISLLTNPFVSAPSSIFGLLLLVGLGVYFFWPTVRAFWQRHTLTVVIGVVSVFALIGGLNALLGRGVAEGLLANLVLLVWFGSVVERHWGRNRLWTFTLLNVLGVNLIALAFLTWAPASVGALLGPSAAPIIGPGPLLDALMTVWCLMNARTRLAILNIEAGKLVWVLVAINVLDLLFTGFLSGVMGLLAIGLAKMIVTGRWTPSQIIDRLRLWRLERRITKRRKNIKLIDNDRHLH
ncbi:MAG: rhomboid family intramembrane serine protease [Myxococcota bacterium]|nr:rhomboid family intramembrane serine protease [Myxococcota bacterium]